MKIKLITHPLCIYKPKAVLQLVYQCPISLTSTLSWQMLFVHWATHYKNMANPMAGFTYPVPSDSTFVMPWIPLALPSPQND